jgi:hypothetical protein
MSILGFAGSGAFVLFSYLIGTSSGASEALEAELLSPAPEASLLDSSSSPDSSSSEPYSSSESEL